MLPQGELGHLEQQYKDSIKNYRALIRQGLDETLYANDGDAQDLFRKTRTLLDEKSVPDARENLEKIALHLTSMKAAFPQAKTQVLTDLHSAIDFLEQKLSTPHFGKTGHAQSDHDIESNIERARFALQNEDWADCRAYFYKAVNRFLDKQQRQLQRLTSSTPTTKAGDTNLSTFDGKNHCRMLAVENIRRIFHLGRQRNGKVIGVGFGASANQVHSLFSELSGQTIVPTASVDAHFPVIRFVLDRQTTVYLIGIPIDADVDLTEFDAVASQLNHLQLNMDESGLPHAITDKIFITALEQIHHQGIQLSGNTIDEDIKTTKIDWLKKLKLAPHSIDSKTVIDWVKQLLS